MSHCHSNGLVISAWGIFTIYARLSDGFTDIQWGLIFLTVCKQVCIHYTVYIDNLCTQLYIYNIDDGSTHTHTHTCTRTHMHAHARTHAILVQLHSTQKDSINNSRSGKISALGTYIYISYYILI